MWKSGDRRTMLRNDVHFQLKVPDGSSYHIRKVRYCMILLCPQIMCSADTPPKFNSSPLKKWCLEDDPFLLGFGNFSGENSLLNFGRVFVSRWCWGMFIAIGSCWSSAAANMSKLGFCPCEWCCDGQWKMKSQFEIYHTSMCVCVLHICIYSILIYIQDMSIHFCM